MSTKMNPTTRLVRSLDGDYFMVREVAETLGVSQTTLRKFLSSEDPEHANLRPSHMVAFGKVNVYLYTRDDVDRIRAYLKARMEVKDFTVTNAPGRPRIYSDAQRRERGRLYTRRHYWKKELDKAKENDDQARMKLARSEIRAINKELKDSA